MDSGGGTIKHRVFRDVKSGKVSIKNAEHFAAHADAILNGIKSLYMSIDEVLNEPEDIEKSSPRIDGTLEVHKIACSFSTDGVCKLGFFKTAVENNHFMYNITRRMGIQMFVLTLSFPCAIILIKSVLSAIVFMPKIRSGWSAIYVINGFIKNVFSFRFFFFWSTVPKQFLQDLDDPRLFVQFFMKFSIVLWRTDKFLNSHLK